MTDSGADPRARSSERSCRGVVAVTNRDDLYVLEIVETLQRGDILEERRLCARTELWAAIETLQTNAERFGVAHESGRIDPALALAELNAARRMVRRMLGMEPET